MGYCTIADIEDQVDERRLVQLTDDDGSGIVASERVDRAISDASDEIDGYVGTRYGVPLSPAPPILRKFAVDIAVYNLYARRDNIPEIRSVRYQAAIQFLRQVALGKISLGPDDPGGNPPDNAVPRMIAPARIFERSKMRGF